MDSTGSVKNIIFDFGGVIMKINPMAYVGRMREMGCTDLKEMHESFLREGVYRDFETGRIDADRFREKIRHHLPNHATNHEIDQAWNLILQDIPESRITLLRNLRQKYRLFLLSNTNPIHYDFYQDYTRKTFNVDSLNSFFEKAYYSFQIGLYKPDRGIFQHVMLESCLEPSETLFIDDMEENIEGARQCGLKVMHVHSGGDITLLLKDY